MNQFWVCFEKTFWVQAKLLLTFGEQVAHKDVGFLGQLAYQFGALGLVQGHSDGLLATVVHIELEIIVLQSLSHALPLDGSAHTSHGVSGNRLDLDHPCAHVR